MKKKRILLSILMGTVVVTTFGAINNITSVSASGIAHTHGPSYTSLYTRNGEEISDRALSGNTPWLVGEIINLNGETMYQVATNEFVKANDVTYEPQHDKPAVKPNNGKNNNNVRVTANAYSTPIFDDQTKEVSMVPYDSTFKVGRIVQSDTGLVYYQVSTHGWMVGDLVKVTGHLENVEQVYGFRPIKPYRGITAEEIRDDMVNWFGCNQDELEKIPDDNVTEEYTISNYSGADISGTYKRLYKINSNIGGSVYYQP